MSNLHRPSQDAGAPVVDASAGTGLNCQRRERLDEEFAPSGRVASRPYSQLMPPIAVPAKYLMTEPDQPIPLYDGAIEVGWEDVSIIGNGSVAFEWQPFSHVAFEVSLDVGWDTPETPDDVTISLVDVGGTAPARVWRVQEGVAANALQPRLVSGSVTDDLLVGNPAATETVIVHVPNLPGWLGEAVQETDDGGAMWKGRMIASTSDWEIVVDSLPDLNGLHEEMSKRPSNAITHVGRVRRADEAPVAFESVGQICDVLHWWFSLVRSERTGPFLVMGVHEDETVWEIWRTPSLAPWRGRWSWLPQMLVEDDGTYTPVNAGETLRSLDDLWDDVDLRRAITRAIDWYTQGVASSYVATTVVLAQAGLELMSWLRLVRDVGLSDDSASKLTAADALRLTLSFAGIPRDVPVTAPDLHLSSQAGPGGQVELDGPGAITEIRNGVVHPKAPARFGDLAMHQGGQLALRALELLLLARLNYSGRLYDRVDWSGPVDVPWRT